MILINRSETKAKAQKKQVLANHPGTKVELITADLLDTRQVMAAAAGMESISGRITALYNNSGVLTSQKHLSPQGLESQFAVNVLAPYLLIRGLTPRMAAPPGGAPAMVVNMSRSL